jgi:hypothetical protein
VVRKETARLKKFN